VTQQVEHGVTGFILTQDRTEEMAERVETLLTNPDMARAFGEAGQRLVRRSFAVDRMVNDYADVLAA
jgi:glycosyltransferase involved in cell wall biosynthesis